MTGFDFLLRWLWAFLFTQTTEVPVYTIALSRSAPHRSLPRRLLLAFGASALTHPPIWLIWYYLPPTGSDVFWRMVVAAELFAVVAEAAYFARLGVQRAFLWSLGANALSFGLGMLQQLYLG